VNVKREQEGFMEEKKFKIIFKGEIVPNTDREKAKQNLASIYRVDVKQVESLFSGKTFVLKENIDLDAAQKFMFQFEEAGIVCEIEEMPLVLEAQVQQAEYEPEPVEQPEEPPAAVEPEPGPIPEAEAAPPPSPPPPESIPEAEIEELPPPPPPPPPSFSAPAAPTPPTAPTAAPIPSVPAASPTPTKPPAPTVPTVPTAPTPPTAPLKPPTQFVYRKAPKKPQALFVLLLIVLAVVIIIIVLKPSSEEETPLDTPARTASPAVSSPRTRETSPQPAAPTTPPRREVSLISTDSIESFNGPDGYYSISLPAGFKTSQKTSKEQGRSEVTFIYADRALVTISAGPRPKDWDSTHAMMQRVAAVQIGKEADLPNYHITSNQLVNFGGLSGYEILLEMGGRVAHVYEMVSTTEKILFIKIIAFGQENHDILDSAIRDNLVVY
jgi:hypothetical protein